MPRVTVRQDADALRRGSYPDTGEQLGALVKGLRALMAGDPLPADALAVLDAVDQVKRKYPKGEAK